MTIVDFSTAEDAFRFFGFQSTTFINRDVFGLVARIRVAAGDLDGDGQVDDTRIRVQEGQNSFAGDVAKIDLLNVTPQQIRNDLASIFLGGEAIADETILFD